MSFLLIAIETTTLTIFFYMLLWFVLSLFEKRNDIVDVAWGLGFIVIAITNLFIFETNILNPRALLVTILVVIWGLRLSLHLKFRLKNNPEDVRYNFVKSGKDAFLKVFMLQGFLMLLISLQIITVANVPNQTGLNFIDFLGVLMWTLGFYFEAVSDFQLYKFKQDATNKGKVLTTGLWRLTRHPNYFGELLQWWGIFLISLNVAYPYISLISPLTITYLLLMVSGIPLLEKKLSQRKDYKTYLSQTPMLFPKFRP